MAEHRGIGIIGQNIIAGIIGPSITGKGETQVNANARSMDMQIVRRGELNGSCRSVVIAANDRARTAPEIDLAGLRFDNYRRNPVVMWAHDATGHSPSGGLPIGRTTSISRSADGGIVAEFEFLEDDPFAQRIRNAWDKGFLRAASISWLPIETAPAANGGVRDVRSELLEWSIVSVPADPDALRESHRRMLNSLLDDETPGARYGRNGDYAGFAKDTDAAGFAQNADAADFAEHAGFAETAASPANADLAQAADLAAIRTLTAQIKRNLEARNY